MQLYKDTQKLKLSKKKSKPYASSQCVWPTFSTQSFNILAANWLTIYTFACMLLVIYVTVKLCIHIPFPRYLTYHLHFSLIVLLKYFLTQICAQMEAKYLYADYRIQKLHLSETNSWCTITFVPILILPIYYLYVLKSNAKILPMTQHFILL